MKKIVSLILSLVMLMSITSGLNLTAYADDVNHYLDFQAEIYSSETAGFDNIFVGTDSSSFSRTLYNNLKNDTKFQVTLAAWSSTHIVDDATYTIENNVFKKKDLYDAILFDMIDSTDESTLCQQYQNEFEKLYKMVKNERSSYVIKTTDMILGKENYTVEQLKTTDLSEDAKDLLLNGTKYAGVTSVISEVNKILGNVKNAYDAINAVADYLAIKDVDCGTSEILNEIASDSQSPIELRYSAAEISDCMAGAYGKTAALIAEGSISGIEFALNKAINYAWDSVLACIPGGTAISFGAKTGRMLVNYFFKTETVIQGYYQLEAAVNIEDAIIRVMQNKKNADTGYTNIDSAVYMKSVDMYKDIILLGFDYSIELLQNAANSDFNTATDFWLGNYSQCMQLIDQIQELKQKKIDNFVKYEEIVFNKYKSLYLPNYDELEDEISKTVPVTALSVTQLVDINIGDSAYFEDCFAYNFEPYNYTESVTNVSVTSSDSNIISVVKGDDSKEKFVANNAGTCTLTFTLNDNVFDNVNVEIGYKQHCIGDIITIGSYPKTLVTDSNLLSKLNSVEFEWKSYHYYSGNGTISTVSTSVANQGNLTKYLSMSESDYMKYSDVKLDGEMYRAVYFDSYRPVKTYYESIDSKTNQINNKYLKNKIYWFKYEPLHWKIFDNQKNLAICEDVIDSQCYQNEILNVSSHGIVRPSVTFANKYLDSSLDNYLSDEFYNSAFSVDEKKYILSQSINSSSSTSTTPEYAKVTVLNTTYTTNLTNASVDFSSFPTDYAKSQGVFVNNNYSNWWIRNDKEGYYAKLQYYDYNGKLVTADDTDVTNTGIGIRPVICFSEEFKNTFEYNHVKYLSDTSNSCYAVSCDDSVNDIVIPDTVFGMKVIGIKNEMFKNNKNLISVSLGNNISDIPREIFSGCNNLKNVILPNKLTKIPENAFRSCNNLNNLTIPNNVNSIGNSVFYGCTKLASITIPNSVTSIGDNAFRSCTSLTSVYYAGTEDEWNKITIGDCNEYLTNATIHYKFAPDPSTVQTGKCGENVTYSLNTSTGVLTISGTGEMTDSPFSQNSNIKSVIIENGVTSIATSAFSGCTSLTSVTIPNSVTSIGDYAFYYCEKLKSVDLSDNITRIGDSAFADCTSLTNVTIPSIVTSIGDNAFSECTSLTDITIPDSVMNIGDGAFLVCISLKSIEVSDNNKNYASVDGVLFNKDASELITYPAGKPNDIYEIPNSVMNIGDGAFFACTSLKSIEVSDNNENYTSVDGVLFNKDASELITYPAGKPNDTYEIPISVKSICYSAFLLCTSLTDVIIANGVTSIGHEAFSYCTSLTSVTIPDSVTSIGHYAFSDCESLKDIYYTGTQDEWNNITIGDGIINLTNATIHYNFETEPSNKQTGSCGDNVTYSLDTETGVLTISGTGKMKDYSGEDSPFYQNSNIKSVIIENGVTSIGNLAFSSCNSLIEVSLPSSIISLGVSAFSGCENLMSISIPANVADIQSIAFAGCKKLTSIEVDSNNENYSSINGVLFDKNITELVCYPAGKNDASYTVPNTVKSFAYGSFYDCENLTSVIIPNGVTSIGGASFWNCKNLKSIVIPKSVTKIDLFSFNGCESLKDIYYTGTQDEWNNITIGDGNINLTSATIHYNFVPCTENQHNYYGEWKIIEEPTCTKVGLKQRTCSFDGYVQKEEISAKGHTEVVINGYAATCEKSGLTDGKKCSVCGEVLVAQKEIAKLDHSYIKTVVEPTCTEQGYTIYKCETCGETYKDDYVKALGHTEVIDEAVAPTCTQSGLTEGKHCSVCNAVLVKQEKIDALGHYFSSNAQFCLNGCGEVNPNYVAPDTSTVQKGSCGDNVIYSLNTETGVLTISGTGEMTDSPFSQNSNIKSVIIENGVTSIVTYAFSGCTSLTSITIPDSVVSVGESAFDGCTSLVSVTLSKSITTIEYSTFFGCSSLTSIEIPKSVTTIVNFAFCNCTNLKDVYYDGTQSEWNKINIGHSNEFLTNASLHCSSTPTPTPTPEPTPTPNPAPQPSTQPTQETPQQAAQQTAQQPSVKNDTTAEQVNVAKPKSVSPKKIKSAKKAVSVEWKKVSGVKGYQVQVATDKKFKKNKKTVTVKKQKTTKTTIKKLKAKKKYYVRVRTYKIVNGKKVYSSWSKVKSVKTK